MRVILNTAPLLLQKSGIGYYIFNLYRELSRSEEVEVYPTVDITSLRTIGFMSRSAQLLQKLFGDTVLKVSVPVGNFLISKAEKKHDSQSAEIYHEANYDTIPKGSWMTVANIHDLTFLRYPEYMSEKVLAKITATFGNIMEAERFIVNTHAIKEELITLKKIPSDRIDVIPHGPSGDYHPVQRSPEKRKQYIDKYTKDDYILCVSTIEPRKNLPTLIKAFRLFKEKNLSVKLIIAGGKGWQYKDTVKLPQNLGIEHDVIYTGYVDERTMLYLYNYASLFVYPSLYEGFGIPVIEAMSCGIPVIISNIPSLTEVAGEAAVPFNPQDYEELAHTMGKIIRSESLKTELGEKGLKKARDYSWKKTVSLTIQTYKKTLAS